MEVAKEFEINPFIKEKEKSLIDKNSMCIRFLRKNFNAS